MMTANTVATKENFTCFHAGPFARFDQYSVDLPEGRVEAKVFLKERVDLKGIEVSLSCMAPHTSFPVFHRHTHNDELYIVVKGQGQFQIDDRVFDVAEGSSVKIAPEGVRIWRNTGDGDLHYLCIQYDRRAPSIGNTFADAQIVEHDTLWMKPGL